MDLTGQYNQICKMKEHVEQEIENFEAEKSKVEKLGEDYQKMITLSGTIEEKIRGLETTYDELQNMEVQVRDFQDNLASISARYDRLEQKNGILDRVVKDVDNSFEYLKTLEDRLSKCKIDVALGRDLSIASGRNPTSSDFA